MLYIYLNKTGDTEMAIGIECTPFIEDEAKFEASKPTWFAPSDTVESVNERFALDPFGDLDCYFGDWFDGDAFEQAKTQSTNEEAEAILRNAYKGSDTLGVGLKWTLKQMAA